MGESGDAAAAVAIFEEVIHRDGGYTDGHYGLALFLDEMGEAEAALEAANAGIAMSEPGARLYAARAYLLLEDGKYRVAIKDADRSIDLDAMGAWAPVSKARAQHALGQTAFAMETLMQDERA